MISRAGRPDAGRADTSPYPWSSLADVARSETEALRTVRRWLGAHFRLDRVGTILEERIGTSARVRVRSTEAATGPLEGAARVAVVPMGRPTEEGILVELEGALANDLVARVLRRSPSVVVKPTAISDSVAGAVAAILASVVRRASLGASLEVRRAAPGEGRPPADAIAVTLTILIGDDAYAARALFPRRLLRLVSTEAPWNRGRLATLGATPLHMAVVAMCMTLRVADVAALGPGDVVVARDWPLGASPPGLAGTVRLAAPASDIGVRADLVDGSRLVLRGQQEPLGATEESMTDEGGGALIEAIGDVPVVVRVEIGEATMSAREWASLGPGDVVGLGRRLGENVLLRIGGVPVARGELVNLDGEVGIRIVARLGEETTTG